MANTPHGYPYPLGTDRLMDGDDSMHSLASAIDGQLGVMASGTAVIPVTAANTATSLAVTFPAGRFNAPPNAAHTANAQNPQNFFTTVSGVTATGMTLWCVRSTGNTSVTTYWVAHLI